MRVTVSAHGELRRYLLAGADERDVELAPAATLADLVEALGAFSDDALLARRGTQVLREQSPLKDGDRIEIFAPVGGG